MLSTIILLCYLLVTVVTDLRWRRIYNSTAYSAILVAFVGNAIYTVVYWFAADDWQDTSTWHGLIGIGPSLLGVFACGGLMLVCYVFFAGGVGGGDIKLIAMIGAYLGIYDGFKAMLWTFVIAAGVAIILLVWRYGLWRLVTRSLKYVLYWVRLGGRFPLTDAEREPLKASKLFLAPSALIAVLVVKFELANLI